MRLGPWLSVVLVVLSLMNAWSAYRTWQDERLPALLNAASAAVMLVFAIVLWSRRGQQQ